MPFILTRKNHENPTENIRAITFLHYPDFTALLFQNLNILHFKKLITQINPLLMFKYHKEVLPDPVNNLFSINSNRFHDLRSWNHI